MILTVCKFILTTSCNFFLETVIVFVELVVVAAVLDVIFDDRFDSTTGTDIFNAIDWERNKQKYNEVNLNI